MKHGIMLGLALTGLLAGGATKLFESNALASLNPTEELRLVSICIDPVWRYNTVAKAMVERPDTTWCPAPKNS